MSQIRDNFKLIKLRPLNGEKTFSFSEYYGQDFDRFQYDTEFNEPKTLCCLPICADVDSKAQMKKCAALMD